MKSEGARALIVEDDRSWQDILKEFFIDAGLQVDITADLESALTLMKMYPHRVAVVDLSLEENDPHNKEGLRILENLSLHDPGCLKVLLTGFATVELAVSAIKDFGAYTCLSKESFNRVQFREIIHRAQTSPTDVLKEVSGQETSSLPLLAVAGNLEQIPGRALVVDDDAGWRSILFELLVDCGYQVRLCSSFGEALGCLRRDKYDLAVIDLSLSGGRPDLKFDQPASTAEMEGYRLLTSTRAMGIPTLVVSGIATPIDIEKTYQEQGIFAFMEKQAFDRKTFSCLVSEAQAAVKTRGELKVLTDREHEVLKLLAQGLTNKEIADTLVISPNTVKRHLKAIFGKLDIHTRSAAAAKITGAKAG
ncbi:MAG: response regulator [Anaerolineaceae bacterium]